MHGGDNLFAHQSKSAHSVVVVHSAVSVPEEHAAGPYVLKEMANLGNPVLEVLEMMV